MELLNHRRGMSPISLNISKLLSKEVVPICIPPGSCSSCCSTSSPTLGIVWLYKLAQSDVCETSHCINFVVVRSFVLLAVWTSASCQCLSLAHFLNQVFSILLTWRSSLHVHIQTLMAICIADISLVCGLSFLCFSASLSVQTFLILMSSILSLFKK